MSTYGPGLTISAQTRPPGVGVKLTSQENEPLVLVIGIEKLAPDQRAHPDREIIRGRDRASGREGIGRILSRVVIGLEGSRIGSGLKIGGIRRVYEELPYK